MRVPVIAGNWKMNMTTEESRMLVHEISLGIREIRNVAKIIIPPFTSLLPAAALLVGTDIDLGAQNMHWEEKGAFTGEISPAMVAEFCRYTLVGHSERRTYFGESDEIANKKMKAALSHNLVPILCVGETLEEKERGLTSSILERQIKKGYEAIDHNQAKNSIIAYEPVWAIGTGIPSSGENANATIKDIIRPLIKNLYGQELANSLRVLYGGSVTKENATEYFIHADIDGALVGGASLKVNQFIGIVEACARN